MIIKMRNDRRTMRRDEIRLTETRRRTERTTDQPTTTRTISDRKSNRNWKRNQEMLFSFLQTSSALELAAVYCFCCPPPACLWSLCVW
ncbi:uncharacterized protein LOC123196985 isoform X2 [Mangifera indica]|uniref:uncharacterized protein LOC123196985 isoform X2 n=1 Tax=Mangifera indica TaxID=29780 RepID=UPI001CF98C69|nr:uncharacterized protein LOC123196985 isoform X2 [Mangifera indica]